MILEYHRPQTLQAALELLARPTPRTIPLGGGSAITHMAEDTQNVHGVAVVDLQALGLNLMARQGNMWVIGAATTLEQIVQHPDSSEALRDAICLDETLNMRNMATLAGAVMTSDGTSALLTVLLALDARLVWQPDGQEISLGDTLAMRSVARAGTLITHIQIPLSATVHFAAVGRSPKDRPLVSVAVARWPSGRTRVVVGGDAPAPILVMDGSEMADLRGDGSGIEILAQNAASQLVARFASREYLGETVKTLIQRLI